MATPIAVRNYNNTAPPTNLTANIDNSVNTTNIPVTSTAGYPPTPFTGCLERNTQQQEFVLVTNIIDANHFLVVRGYDGTPPVAHLSPGTFEHTTGAIDFREANQHHTDTTRDDHLQYVPVNGSRAITGIQTFASGINAQYLSLAGFPGSYIQTRYVGGTGPGLGPPGGGTFQVGDFIRDPSGVEYTNQVAGSPGTWVPEPGRTIAHVWAPGAAHNVVNTTYTALSYNFSYVKNVQYILDVAVWGTVQVAIPGYVNSLVSVSAGLTTGWVWILSENATALSVNGVYGNHRTTALNTPSSNGTATITVQVTSSGGGGARYNLASNAVEMILRRG